MPCPLHQQTVIELNSEIKLNWHGKSYHMKVPAKLINYDLYQYLSDNVGQLTANDVEYRAIVFNLDTPEILLTNPTCVQGKFFNYKTWEFDFFGNSLNDFYNFFLQYQHFIKYTGKTKLKYTDAKIN